MLNLILIESDSSGLNPEESGIACRNPYILFLGLPGDSDGKESACSAGDPGLISGLEDPLEEGRANSSILGLENCKDRGAWRATVREVTKSDTTEQLTLSPPFIGTLYTRSSTQFLFAVCFMANNTPSFFMVRWLLAG